VLTPARLWAAAAACLLAAVPLGVAAAGASPGAVDVAFATTLVQLREAAPWLVHVSLVLAVLGSRQVMLPVVVGVGVLLWLRGERLWSVWLLASGLGGWLLTEAVKVGVQRARPPDAVVDAFGWAFPSGHTTTGVCSLLPLGVVCLALLPPPWGRWAGWSLVTLGLLMGPSRWVLGVHWLTDVVAGWLIGGAWVLAVSAAVLQYRRARGQLLPG
jgi:undecaprenyl-diphosphatase